MHIKKLMLVILSLMLLVGCSEKGTVPKVPPVRIAYNYCTLSYTFSYWGKAEWTKELDRLEKAGYNAALLLNGLPTVWREVLRASGFSEEEILSFIADDSARAWWHMGNLEGLGGPLSEEQFAADLDLGKWLYKEMKRRGIEPMIQGFIGFLPHTAVGRFPAFDQGKWCQIYTRPAILMPNSKEFAEISSLWYDTLKKVYEMDENGEAKYLVGDLFHEGGLTGGLNDEELAEIGRSIQARQIEKFGKGVTWVLQAWQMNPAQKALIKGLNTENTLIEVLDKHMGSLAPLTCDLKNAAGEHLPWVWAEVSNFGGNTGIRGALTRFATMNVIDPEAKDSFRGYAMLSEGLETNPAMYALFERNMLLPPGEAMTFNEQHDFFVDFFKNRYGCESGPVGIAIMAHITDGAWIDPSPTPTEGCVENILCAYPAFDLKTRAVSTWGTVGGTPYPYNKIGMVASAYFDAAYQNPALLENEAFRFDAVEVFMQLIADRAREIIEDCEKDAAKRAEFMELLDFAEEIASCSDLWRLDYQESRRVGTVPNNQGTVPGYRRLITSWTGDLYTAWESGLHEYAHRAYAGLIKYYYRPRWKWFFQYHEEKITAEEFVRRCAELDKNFPFVKLPPTPRPDLMEVMKKLNIKLTYK